MAWCGSCDMNVGHYPQPGFPNGPLYCARCFERLSASGGRSHENVRSPRYSDSADTRELYNRLMSAPNAEYRHLRK